MQILTIDPAVNLVLLLLILSSFITDITKKKIYNFQTYPAMVIGLLLGFVSSGGQGVLMSFLGLLSGMGLLFLFFLAGGVAAGDVKLLGAVGALKGSVFVLWTMFYTGLIGGIMAFAYIIWKGKLLSTLKSVFRILRHPVKGRQEEDENMKLYLPYGVAISLGAGWALFTVYKG